MSVLRVTEESIDNVSALGSVPIPIWNGVSWMNLGATHISLEYTQFRDVDAFKVALGCTATSQFGYVYKPNSNSAKVYYDSTGNNTMNLKLKYRCYA